MVTDEVGKTPSERHLEYEEGNFVDCARGTERLNSFPTTGPLTKKSQIPGAVSSWATPGCRHHRTASGAVVQVAQGTQSLAHVSEPVGHVRRVVRTIARWFTGFGSTREPMPGRWHVNHVSICMSWGRFGEIEVEMKVFLFLRAFSRFKYL